MTLATLFAGHPKSPRPFAALAAAVAASVLWLATLHGPALLPAPVQTSGAHAPLAA